MRHEDRFRQSTSFHMYVFYQRKTIQGKKWAGTRQNVELIHELIQIFFIIYCIRNFNMAIMGMQHFQIRIPHIRADSRNPKETAQV